MKIIQLLSLGLLPFFVASCASNSVTKAYFREFSGPSIKQLGIKKIQPNDVIIKPFSSLKGRDKTPENVANFDSSSVVKLGISAYTKEGPVDVSEIRNFAASIGARIVYLESRYLGKGKKTIAVPIAHTPGRTITSSSNTSGSLNTSSYSYGSIGSTPYYGNSYGSGSYSGTTNSSTYIPSSTTYAPRQVGYAAYGVNALFCAPKSSISQSGNEGIRGHLKEVEKY